MVIKNLVAVRYSKSVQKQLSFFLSAILLSLSLLACTPEISPSPTVNLPGATPTTTPPEPTATSTPNLSTPTINPTSTSALPTAVTTPATSPTLQPTVNSTPTALVAPTITPSPAPTSTPEPVLSTPVPSPSPVPIQPVKRSGGTLLIGVLEDNLRRRNYSPYAPDLNETSRHLQRLIWNAGLIYRDPMRLDWRPLAAKGMPTVDSDGKRYAFSLRDNLSWSDGTPITSADYIFALNSFNALPENSRAAGLNELQRIETISGPDLRTLIFTFKEATATNLNVIGLLEPLPSHIWRNLPFGANSEMMRPTVTSGPYKPDTTGLSFTPVANYFLGRPNLERISVRTGRSINEIYDNLRVGVLNWTFEDLPTTLYEPLLASGNLTVYKWTPQDARQRVLAYNLDNPFLNKAAVRSALNKTVDLRSLIAATESGLAIEQAGFLPVSHEFALKSISASRFNLRQVRDELKNAGYSQPETGTALVDKQNKPVGPLRLIYSETNPEIAQIANYIRQQYQQLGLNVVLEKLEPANYRQRRSAGEFELDLATLQISNAPDPDYYKDLFITKGKLNWYGYSNPRIDTLFAEASRQTEVSQKRLLYEQIQRILADDGALFFLYTLQEYTAMSSNFDPGGAGALNLTRWQLTDWDLFPAYLNWYATN